MTIATTPTTLAQGGTLTLTISNYVSGNLWVCYKSGTDAVSSSPSCAAAGSASTVTASGSGAAVVCTASQSNGNAVSLTWTEKGQDNIRARVCTSASDTTHADNANVALTESELIWTSANTTTSKVSGEAPGNLVFTLGILAPLLIAIGQGLPINCLDFKSSLTKELSKES